MANFSTQPAVGDGASASNQDNLISNEVIADSGTQAITPSGVNAVTTVAVGFNKTFPSAPKVMLQFTTGISGAGTCFVWPTSITTTGFTLNINRSSTTTTSVQWLAELNQ